MTARQDGGSGVWVIVPVKSLQSAKSRLAPALSASQRAALARILLERTIGVLDRCSQIDRRLIVSRDACVHQIASSSAWHAIDEHEGDDLNAALRLGRELALAEGASAVLILAADLPLLSPEDVTVLVNEGVQAGVAIAPDRRGRGTNGLVLRPPAAIDVSFGDGSFERHLSLARAAGIRAAVVQREGAAFDLDTPEDIQALFDAGWRLPALADVSTAPPA